MDFWFDDGWEEDYSRTLPFLLEKKCTGISALVTGSVCQPGYMCLRKIRALIGCGWKIASHGTSHESMLDMDMERTRRFLVVSKKWIIDNLHVEPCAFVAPWNVMRPEQVELALEHYPEVRDPKVLHFHSNNYADVQRTINMILQGGPDVYAGIERRRYHSSRAYVKIKFGVAV